MRWQQAFEVFAAKGPVNVPGAQRRAQRAWWALRDVLTPEERAALGTARSHALYGEGRQEFDTTVARIRNRLLPK